MKKLLQLTFLILLILGCKTKNSKVVSNNSSSEITYEVKVDSKEGFENDVMPWISIKNPKSEIENLIGRNDIVINKKSAILVIDYPLEKPVEININSKDNNGFKRGELIEIISREYNRIYIEEEESSKTKTVPLNEREGLINRNKTNGKYGIWGHDIDDLDLSRIIILKSKNGELRLELIVES